MAKVVDFPIPVPFTIDITEREIESGLRRNCYHCPAARAFARLLPVSASVAIYGRVMVVRRGERCWVITVPDVLFEWIWDYDECEQAQPISVKIRKSHFVNPREAA